MEDGRAHVAGPAPSHGPSTYGSPECETEEHGPLGPTRDMLKGLFMWCSLESGRDEELDAPGAAMVLDGPLFGLPVARWRQWYEINFGR